MTAAPYTAAELAAIGARAEAATAGPWAQFIDRGASQLVVMPAGRPGTIATISGANYDADGLFIALARADVPRLVAELTRARERIETLETVAARIEADAVPHGKRFSVARGLMADLFQS